MNIPVNAFPERSTEFTARVTCVPDAAFAELIFVVGINMIEKIRIIPNNE